MDVTTCVNTNVYTELRRRHDSSKKSHVFDLMASGKFFELWENLSEEEVLELPWKNSWDRALSFYLFDDVSEVAKLKRSLRSAATYSRVYT